MRFPLLTFPATALLTTALLQAPEAEAAAAGIHSGSEPSAVTASPEGIRLRVASGEPATKTLPSLETFLDAALSQAPELREGRARARQREAEAELSSSRLLPSINLAGTYTRNQYEISASIPDGRGGLKEAVISPRHQLDATVGVTLPLLDLPTYARTAAAKDEALAANAELELAGDALAQRVARAYYQLLGGEGLVRAASSALEASKAGLAKVEARRAQGLASELEVERAKAELPRQEQALIEAQLSRTQAARRLERWTGLEATGEVPAGVLGVEATRREELDAPRTSWQRDLGQVPTVEAANAHARASASLHEAAGFALLPTVSANARERVTNAAGFSRSPLWAAGLIADWRLDLGLLPALRAQRALAEQGQAAADRAKRDAREAIDEAFDALESARARLLSAQARESTSDRAAAVARSRYEAGTSTQLELLEAERDAFASRANRVQQEAELGYAAFALRLSAGRWRSHPSPRPQP